MKRFFAIAMAMMVLIGCLVAPLKASADSISGDTGKTVSFSVKITASDGRFVLHSYKGTAYVKQHNWIGKFTGYGNEQHYGFFRMTVSGNGLTRSYIIAPSATTKKSSVITCVKYTLVFPETGTYKVTITPLSNSEAAKYWRVDSIEKWVKKATWTLESGCGCSIIK